MSVARQFEAWIDNLRRMGLPAPDMLTPGLDPKEVRAVVGGLGLDCPEELVELYGCSGGLEAPADTLLGQTWMFGLQSLLPFWEAVRVYEDLGHGPRWDAAWFPMFNNGGGDFHLVNCRAEHPEWKTITYFALGSGEPAFIEYSSLENMLTVINECFDQGLCSVDEQGCLETEFDGADLITAARNPGLLMPR